MSAYVNTGRCLVKIGILADIHSNIRALEAVLSNFKKQDVDKVFCLGDMIGYYHNPAEVINLLKSIRASCILGNHEAYLLGYKKCSIEKWRLCFLDLAKEKFTTHQFNWLKELPDSLELTINSKKIAFFHGSPWDHLEGYVYPDFSGFEKFHKLSYDFIFLGHTHHKMLKVFKNTRIVNPGSCGQPRDEKNKANAAIVNLDENGVIFIRETYDVAKTIKEAKSVGVSKEAILRLETVNL